MPPIAALRQDAMQHHGAGRAVAHAGGELQIDERRDPVRARGDIAARIAAPTVLVALPTCTTRFRPSSPASLVEGSASKSAKVSSSRMRTSCSSASLRTRWATAGDERRPGRILQAGGGQIEARPMFGEELRERGDVGAVGGHRNGVGLRPAGSQERVEVEIAGIVDHDGVARSSSRNGRRDRAPGSRNR